jgi:23S rRNA (guanosine2251-2'-O)-methyltransferase
MCYIVNTLEKQANNYIYGRHPVEELLKTSPKKINKIFLREGVRKPDIATIMTLTSVHRIPVVSISKKKVIDLVGDVNDQGIIAESSPTEYLELDQWVEGLDMSKNPAVFVLDEITDPHNMGAILRTAAAVGIAGVIIGKHNQVPINGTVWKTSAGMAGHVPIVRVTNINATLISLKKSGFWICGLSAHGDPLWKQDLAMPVIFVVGSEGEGIHMQTLKQCDFAISIPMQKGVESLNASVSTAIVGYEWLRQNSKFK